MIIDTSAIIAILKHEPMAEACLLALETDRDHRISAATLLEASLVVDNAPNPDFASRFDKFLQQQAVRIAPVTETQARLARLAHRRFGRGNDPKAKLNFGDCFAYALAREKNEPLLFVGDDFTHTDIPPALGA